MENWERGLPDSPACGMKDNRKAEEPALPTVEIKFCLPYHVVIKMARR
jgi:hypothetical protein